MGAVEELRSGLPEVAKDTKLNLQSVLLSEGTLSAAQRWGVALASAVATRNQVLREAVLKDARAEVSPETVEDALAAAALMAMNNVYYRFRHYMEGSPAGYSDKPAKLRMNRLAKVAGSKIDFELMSLAVSAINGCEMCIKAHEKVVLEGGLTADHVHDAVRLAATIQATAVALEIGTLPTT